MSKIDLTFNEQVLSSLVGGLSVLEIPQLNIQDIEQAQAFIRAYGYDVKDEKHEKKLWTYHRRAVTYMQTELLEKGEEIPSVLTDPHQLKDLSYLLIYASTRDQRQNSLQRWSCGILKVMHVLVHLDNDLFTSFSTEIQDQILRPIQSHVQSDPATGIYLGTSPKTEWIPLKKFETKSFKTSESSVTKLLAKPEVVAFTILDKMGVRFVTKHLFDVFRVMRYLTNENLVSFPHNVPDQSNNTLYPHNLFMETIENFAHGQDLTVEKLDRALKEKLAKEFTRAEFKEKYNQFSSDSYKFIKFITRHLVRVNVGTSEQPRKMSFFYPFEVQIVDYETYLGHLSGASTHDRYKERQRRMARARVLGLKVDMGDVD